MLRSGSSVSASCLTVFNEPLAARMETLPAELIRQVVLNVRYIMINALRTHVYGHADSTPNCRSTHSST